MPKPISRASHRKSPVKTASKEEASDSGAMNESKPRKSRRRFTAAEKVRLVKAADAALASGERGALQALLRREGLYSSHITSWRRQLAARGLEGLNAKRGRKPKFAPHERENQALTKRNAALERKLQIANAVIDLQKKAHAILGLAQTESDEEK